MKRALFLFLATLAVMLPGRADATDIEADIDLGNKTRVALCHNDNNPHVIIVAESALAAHLTHGDVHLGTGLRADLVAQFGKAGSDCTIPVPTFRVCVNGEVKDVVKLEAGMTLLGEGEACPEPTTVVIEKPVEVIKEVVKEVVKEVPVEKVVEVTREAPHTVCDVGGFPVKVDLGTACPQPLSAPTPPAPAAPPAAAPAADAELPRTGGAAGVLAGAGLILSGLGLAIRRLVRR